MTPTAGTIIELVDRIAPFDLAENWDNSGLAAGNPEWPVQKILVALDVTREVMAAAKAWQADMVLTHHPLFITPEKTIDFRKMPGAAIAAAAMNRICIVAAHTNLDKARDGLNDYFCQRADLTCGSPLLPEPDETGGQNLGIGRVGDLKTPLPLEEVAHRIKRRLNLDHLRLVGDPGLEIRRVAVCTGSGGSLLPAFFRSGADLYITGDVKYHEARDVQEQGKALMDVGHFGSEIIAVELLANAVENAAEAESFQIEIKGFGLEKDPFTIV